MLHSTRSCELHTGKPWVGPETIPRHFVQFLRIVCLRMFWWSRLCWFVVETGCVVALCRTSLMNPTKAADGEDPLPVPYRFILSPSRSGTCNVFKPNSIQKGDDGAEVTLKQLGWSNLSNQIVWLQDLLDGNLCQGIRQLEQPGLATWTNCPRAKLPVFVGRFHGSWWIYSIYFVSVILKATALCYPQVQLQTGAAVAQIRGVKPKLYLTATLKMPAKSWVKLSWSARTMNVSVVLSRVFD